MRIVPGTGSKLTFDEVATMERIARSVAARYARRVWWVEREELEQCAWEALLVSAHTFDDTEGTPFAAWCWTVSRNAVTRSMVNASAPVTSHGRARTLIGLQRAPLDAQASSAVFSQPVERAELSALNAENRPDRIYATASVIASVRAQLTRLLGAESTPFALAVFTGEFKPAEIATFNSITVDRVYALRQRVRSILLGDETMHALWEESRT